MTTSRSDVTGMMGFGMVGIPDSSGFIQIERLYMAIILSSHMLVGWCFSNIQIHCCWRGPWKNRQLISKHNIVDHHFPPVTPASAPVKSPFHRYSCFDWCRSLTFNASALDCLLEAWPKFRRRKRNTWRMDGRLSRWIYVRLCVMCIDLYAVSVCLKI